MIKEKEKLHLSIDRETLLCLPVLLALVVLGMVLTAANFADKFLPGTRVDGVDCAALSAEAAADRLTEAAAAESVTLRDGGTGEVILTAPLADYADPAALRAALAELLAEQKTGRGFFAYLSPGRYDYAAPLFGTADAETLAAGLESALYGGTVRVEPQNAWLELDGDSYRLVPEVVGNAVDVRACAEALRSFLLAGGQLADGTADYAVSVDGGRILPAVTAATPALAAAKAALDAYVSQSVALDFQNGNVVSLTPEEIYGVSRIRYNRDGIVCRPDREKLSALVSALADQWGSDGVARKYLHVEATRETVYYRDGDWGFRMDRDALTDAVQAALLAGEPATVTPTYDYTSYLEQRYGLGNTLVEISIDNQYLWFYRDGVLLTETPVTTGNVETWDNTRTGVFAIYWKTADTVLRGSGYAYHVDYWMPFDDQIGLHDSDWRTEYGGDYYLTSGSHGCVNTPLASMAVIFDNTWVGVPVIVY